MYPIPWLALFLAAALFCLGMFGVLVRRNALVVFMCVELMLNAANLTFLAFARMRGDDIGHVSAFFVIAVAAAEAAVGPGHRDCRVPQPRQRQHRRHQDDEALTRSPALRELPHGLLQPPQDRAHRPRCPGPIAVDDHRAAAAGRVHLRRVRQDAGPGEREPHCLLRRGRRLRAVGAGLLGHQPHGQRRARVRDEHLRRSAVALRPVE